MRIARRRRIASGWQACSAKRSSGFCLLPATNRVTYQGRPTCASLPPTRLVAMKRTILLLLGVLASAPSLRADEPVDYLRDVKPIFAKHCVACHGPSKHRADLRLDTAAHAMQGGNS